MNRLTASMLALTLAVPALAEDVAEPRSGVKFAVKDRDMSLLGVGLRTRTVLKVKVYAIGLYVADSALAGPLKGRAGTPELYSQLVNGEFPKRLVLKFVRDVTADQVREAFRDGLKGAPAKTESWINYFGDTRSGQEYVIGWTPGVGLETRVAGVDKPAINDKALAAAVFGIWLGAKPIQDDIKTDLVARGAALVK